MTQTLIPGAVDQLPRIRALAGVLSNQIAAGEVIERPASVVKELIENSLDASARRIQIEVEAGGVALMRVRDDGCGIHPHDLKLALSRHATSKIASLGDLERIKSFGFRGEALPSIASVSRLTLSSRTADCDSGFEVVAEGPVAETIRPVGLPPGTLVSVRDLFFNTPARRKFLRTERTEFRHLEEVVKRAALSRFEVGLSFHHNGKEVFKLAPAAASEARRTRVSRLLGGAFPEQALEVDIEGPDMSLKGWLGIPDAARAQTDLQYFFINGRAVRNSTARHAVRQAFGERLAPGRHPAYVLYLDLDPYLVDVNVHPAKHEVRFRESRLVHDFLWRGLSRALDQALAPTLRGSAASSPPSVGFVAAGTAQVPRSGGGREIQDWGAVYRTGSESKTREPSPPASSFGFAAAPPPAVIAGRYAVSFSGNGVLLIDMARTRRAIILHQLRAEHAQGSAVSRPLLLPLSYGIGEALADRLESSIDALSAAGFDLRRSAPGSITLRAVPPCLAHVPAPALLDALLRWAEGSPHPEAEALTDALATIGAAHLEDLVKDGQALAALVRFLHAHPDVDQQDLTIRLDAAAIADLFER